MGEEEACEECIVDTSKLLAAKKGKPLVGKPKNSVLVFITFGTYGHADDLFSAVHVANGVLAKEANSTIILLDDGVYCAVNGHDPTAIGLPPVTKLLSDFIELGGRLLAVNDSLEKRGISKEDLIEGVEIIENSQIVDEIKKHDVTVTF